MLLTETCSCSRLYGIPIAWWKKHQRQFRLNYSLSQKDLFLSWSYYVCQKNNILREVQRIENLTFHDRMKSLIVHFLEESSARKKRFEIFWPLSCTCGSFWGFFDTIIFHIIERPIFRIPNILFVYFFIDFFVKHIFFEARLERVVDGATDCWSYFWSSKK